jgi:tetratricopeptide (TPR) repeat protein
LPSSLAAGEWAHGQELLDDFVVERTLGEGGMGKVYLLCSRSTASRFAVKRAKGFKEADRRNFLAELQTWIDLPEHVNLVPCRFFRTMGDEVLIFAEYVEGGSLKEWIDSRKLYEGGARQALERMLDVAIQFAWGLHCLHELGLVHQDVKPGNVLMGTNGKTALQEVRPRVTDYGLTRARAAAGETFSTDPSRSILVSSSGGTPAYWSPEQAAGLPLTRKTDIWSWGVSVLEMFTGEVTWRSGQGAAEVIEQHLRQGGYDEAIPAMPDRLSELLRQCFLEKPRERPTSLGEAADRLKVIYQESVGRNYSRTLNVIERAALSQTGIKERRTAFRAVWKDPQEWLEMALRAAGRDPAEAATMVAGRGVTRQGELVAEMAAYDEAKRLYLQLVRGGKNELERDLAILCFDKALVHRTAADLHGALQEYDQAIAILERLVNQEGLRELANELAAVYTNKAITVRALGDVRGAVALYDQAMAILERLVNQEGRRELANDLAAIYMTKAIAVSDLGDHRGAVALYDQAMAILERLVNQEGRRELANDLAAVYENKAIAVSDLGDHRGAVALYDQAMAILERLVNHEGRRELANDLARVYTNKAYAVRALGDHRGAVALLNQAMAILERLVNQEGRRELANDLALVYMKKAHAVSDLGDHRGAVALLDQAMAIRERLVNQEGRRELANDLALVYINKAISVMALGDHRGAVALWDQATAILERLVKQEGRRELVGDLARLKAYRGETLITLGEKENGLQDMRSAQRILEAEIARTGRTDLKQDLTWLQQQLTKHSA